jgi:nifR3 family TIM-barrel protein
VPRIDIRTVLAANPFVAAPMDGYSDYPFRAVCRQCGAGLTFTEMIPAIALTFGAKDARRRVKVHGDDDPLAIQIEGSKPEVMARGAAMAQEAGAHFIDVNAGCPSRRVTNGGAGAALLSDLELMARTLRAVRDAVTVPVTLKFRSGPSTGHLVIDEVAQMAMDCGVDALTLHARTRSQGYRGRADWSHIARLVERVSLPVIGNGDVVHADDGRRMLQQTGCAGVMVGRGAIGNPWLFGELRAAWAGLPPPPRPTRTQWLATVLEHYDRMTDYLGRDPELAARLFRKHLSRYTRGMRGAVSLRRHLASVLNRPSLLAAIHEVLADESPVEAGSADAMDQPMPAHDGTGFVVPEG